MSEAIDTHHVLLAHNDARGHAAHCGTLLRLLLLLLLLLLHSCVRGRERSEYSRSHTNVMFPLKHDQKTNSPSSSFAAAAFAAAASASWLPKKRESVDKRVVELAAFYTQFTNRMKVGCKDEEHALTSTHSRPRHHCSASHSGHCKQIWLKRCD